MGRERKGCGCGDIIDPHDGFEDGEFGRRRGVFPRDIRTLLIALSENEDDNARRATLIIDACINHCLIEDAIIIAVTDNTVVVRECEKFRFVCISCICEVLVNCEGLVEGIFDGRNNIRRI